MVTSLQDMLTQTAPREVTISGWEPDSEITVRIRKPNFYALLAADAVPNPLIPVVQKLFARTASADDYAKPTPEFARALMAIARETLVEPTLDTLTEEGISLTDEQMLELSIYATGGAKALATFRGALRGHPRGDGADVPKSAE